jgi:hypothetical protein
MLAGVSLASGKGSGNMVALLGNTEFRQAQPGFHGAEGERIVVELILALKGLQDFCLASFRTPSGSTIDST